MGKKTINVILNSNNKLSGGTNNRAQYFIDWGAILENNVKYKMHWTYVGQVNTYATTANTLKTAQVNIDFGMENFLNRTSSYGAPTTQCIGMLRPFYLGTATMYLYADDNNNPAVYLPYRPQNNTFTVSIFNNDATPALWTDNATPTAQPPGNYMLVLSFQELDTEED